MFHVRHEKYDRQSILNFVSCKGSVMTEEGIKKAQKYKETAKKATLFTMFVIVLWSFAVKCSAVERYDCKNSFYCTDNRDININFGIKILFWNKIKHRNT